CAIISQIRPGKTKNVQCNKMEGHYVIVVIPGKDKLFMLCEVEVGIYHSCSVSTPPPNNSPIFSNFFHNIHSSSFSSFNQCFNSPIRSSVHPSSTSFHHVLLRGRKVTVVTKKLCWSDAMFYCRDHYGDPLIVRSKDEQRAVEDLLRRSDLPSFTPHLWLGLRRCST
ncbi:unnamed protein product, partial [Coregonus sp. 'balchen']